MAFEAGNVECWAFRPTGGKPHSIEGIGWEQLWNVRFHAESGSCLPFTPSDCIAPNMEMVDCNCPVMAMGVSRGSTLALSVSADHLVGRYDLKVCHWGHSLECIQ